jgi:hypothetical protein
MNHYVYQPRMTNSGIAFTVLNGIDQHECLISIDALEQVAKIKNVDASDADPMDIFHAFERTISGVAQRLIASNAFSPLVLLRRECF